MGWLYDFQSLSHHRYGSLSKDSKIGLILTPRQSYCLLLHQRMVSQALNTYLLTHLGSWWRTWRLVNWRVDSHPRLCCRASAGSPRQSLVDSTCGRSYGRQVREWTIHWSLLNPLLFLSNNACSLFVLDLDLKSRREFLGLWLSYQ